MCALGLVLAALLAPDGADASERAVIGAAFFYWYTFDYERETGAWHGGIYNTPLEGYYDSMSYEDNLRSLRVAADWGITDCFMDYWGPGWTDHEGRPRELLLTRATEQLQSEGFNIHMSMYQDAEDFDMEDLAANLGDGRHADWWIRNVAVPSPAWMTYHGRPTGLIYARNGTPKGPDGLAGFATFVKQRYGDIALLNRAWGTSYTSFDDVEFEQPWGIPRADYTDYVVATWAERWAALQDGAKERYGIPGLELSFDIGFLPYAGLGFTNYVSVFGGPHSYAGVEVPHDYDQERFIYHAAARYEDRPSYDHHKCYYHDWAIRIPGASWWPDPFRFDRSFANMLTRYASSTLHMSWNEWWEGSNLEPCEEFGKKPCETNLFYSTIMQECYDSLRRPAPNARVAVILNEWPFAVGSPAYTELYGILDSLRRLGIPFEGVPGAYATTDRLRQYAVIFAPGCDAGLDRDGRTARTLLALARSGKTVVASSAPDVRRALRLSERHAAASAGGPSNAWFDIGVPGDEACIVGGTSGREDWGRLGPGAFGASPASYTVRWTPGVGRALVLRLPVSPGRDHVLRLAGSAVAAHGARVSVDGLEVGRLEIEPGHREYELRVPADAVGSRASVIVTILYDKAVVPKELDPARYPSETRSCNLALDWVQMFTPEFAAGERQRVPEPAVERTLPEPGPMEPLGPVQMAQVTGRVPLRDRGTVLSRYETDGVPRELLLQVGSGRFGYINGLFNDTPGPDRLRAWIRDVGGIADEPVVSGADCAGVALSAGLTHVLPVYNYTVGSPRRVSFKVPADGLPIATVRALRRDGLEDIALEFTAAGGDASFGDTVRYFGVYEVVRGSVRAELTPIELVPGQTVTWQIPLANLTDATVTATASFHAVTPTIHVPADGVGSASATVTLPPRGNARAELAIHAREDADWGRKTGVLSVVTDAGEAKWFVTVVVRPLPELAVETPVLDSAGPEIGVAVKPNRHLAPAPAEDVVVRIAGETIRLGTLAAGESRVVRPTFSLARATDPSDDFAETTARASWKCGGRTFESLVPVQIGFEDSPAVPPGAVAKLVAYNPGRERDAQRYVRAAIPTGALDPGDLSVRDAASDPVPSFIERVGDEIIVHAITEVPPRKGRCLFVCRGADFAPETDLSVSAENLGSGRGRLRVENSYYAITLREELGGCASGLVSKSSGRDYGARTFGASGGTFKRLPPDGTAFGDRNTVLDNQVFQREGSGLITVEGPGQGGVLLRATVTWESDVLEAEQRYTFIAGQPYFLVDARVKRRPMLVGDEICALDFRLARNRLTKAYPNWVGIVEGFSGSNPHCGWRDTTYVPEFTTLLEVPDPANGEAWTLGILESEGLSRMRTGFWPARRPEPGTCEYAEVELVSEHDAARALCAVVLHRGHHVTGREMVLAIKRPELVTARLLATDGQ